MAPDQVRNPEDELAKLLKKQSEPAVIGPIATGAARVERTRTAKDASPRRF